MLNRSRSAFSSLTHTVTDWWRSASHAAQVVTHARSWRLWTWSRPAIAFLLVDELLVAAWLVASATTSTITGHDLVLLAILLACGIAHVSITSADEERRRAAHGDSTHIDMTCIWVLPAAVLLPPALAAILVVALRLQRLRIARKPLFKWLHTTVAMICSVLCVHLVSSATPLPQWLAAGILTSRHDMPAVAGCLGATVIAYYGAQTVLVSGVRALAYRFPRDNQRPAPETQSTFVYAVGTWWDNWLFGFALLLAFIGTIALTVAPELAVLLLPIGVFVQLLVQRWEESRTDTRTRALTDVGFRVPAQRILQRSTFARKPVSLAMIDIDRFKAINDTHGHPAGNEVLSAVAALIDSTVRDSHDLFCRWGGEEFVVLMRDTDLPAALQAAERMRTTVAGEDIMITDRKTGDEIRLGGSDRKRPSCTVSIGVATAPEHGTTLDELVQHADQALYRAKNAGRNRVEAAPTPVEPPTHQALDEAQSA
ncbi:diguanylate cyclase (GGDEF)-like protein [Labedaea rhizosphaerae]|uniref:Diguanylate cyclase (GGDEF)-like protein n=1 Tax=Labedaea rhizosphaerae TaxID=598644 RepID=A0A4R6SG30_LABRH|nr:diguanylate cyclase (GGDEF)-like protein [Labedaea rhizosphaerae]